MSVIKVSQLSKTFQSYKRREGISGSIRDLISRQYHAVNAVESISFSVEQGELLGYIGPNGAGKSTSIKMLTGILKPTSGEIAVMGFSPFKDRKEYTAHIGVVFGQRTQLWWDIAVIESLRLLGQIYKVPKTEFAQRLENLTEILELKELLNTPVRKLSLGQRVRCDIAASLIYGPSILFLDEPTIGLDAMGKDAVRKFLRKINQEFKTTIIMTTHDLKEIEELCKRIMIIDKGKIIYDGDLHKIKNMSGLKRQISIEFTEEVAIADLNHKFSERATFEPQSSKRVQGSYDPQIVTTPDLVKEIVELYDVSDFTINEPEIEEVVMKIYREGVNQTG